MKCSECIDNWKDSFTDSELPISLISCLENPKNWKNTCLKLRHHVWAKKEYWKVHKDEKQLLYLYQYLTYK